MSNDNLKESAFPITLQHGLTADSHVDVGFTKHEYAAILLAQGMLSNYTNSDLTRMPNIDQIVDTSYLLAAQLLKRFP